MEQWSSTLQRWLRFEALLGVRGPTLLNNGDLEPYSTWQFKRSELIHQGTFVVIALLMVFTDTFELLVAPETSLLLMRVTPLGLFLNIVQFTAPLALLVLRALAGHAKDQNWAQTVSANSFGAVVFSWYALLLHERVVELDVECPPGNAGAVDKAYALWAEVSISPFLIVICMFTFGMSYPMGTLCSLPNAPATLFATTKLSRCTGTTSDFTLIVLALCLIATSNAVLALLTWVGHSLYNEHAQVRRLHAEKLKVQQTAAAEKLRLQRASASEKLAQLEAQEQLSNYLMHEIRNDQNVIVGAFQFIMEEIESGRGALPADATEMVSEGRAHAYHASRIIANTLMLARLAAGKLMKPPTTAFHVFNIMDTVLALAQHMLQSNQAVELSSEVPPDLPRVCGAADLIEQVLLNLVTNAVKYTDDGHIVARVRKLGSRAGPQAGEALPSRGRVPESIFLEFSVSDTGSGVPPEKQDTIFEPFETGLRPGTGLGIPIVCSLLELMGSKLCLDSPASGGATFSFVLKLPVDFTHVSLVPAPSATPSQHKSQQPPLDAHLVDGVPDAEPGPLNQLEGLDVLVADDSKSNRLIVGHMLRKALPGVSITMAENGEDALNLLRERTFDIAVLDEHFGVKGTLAGTDVSRIFRLEQPDSTVLIIGCTGNTGWETHEQLARQSGQQATWGKPLPMPSDLREDLAKLLMRARSSGRAFMGGSGRP